TQDALAFLDFLLLLAFGADGDDGAVDIDMDVFLLYAGQLGMHEVAVVLRLDVDLDGGEFAVIAAIADRPHEEAAEEVVERVITGEAAHEGSPVVGWQGYSCVPRR